MKSVLENFLTSGWTFTIEQIEVKSKVQMINVSTALSTFGLLFGITINIVHYNHIFLYSEIVALIINIISMTALRYNYKYFDIITTLLTALYTYFFLFLIYKSEVDDLRHVWIFTYPLILLFFQGIKKAIIWMVIIVSLLLIAPLQPFIDVSYSLFQIIYILVVFFIIAIVIYFYQHKMNEIKEIILQQQGMLKHFNEQLESEVNDKVQKLRELNELLEIKVEEKLDELRAKDKILEVQSKQAVMGEMISMIAHQWRQPLSTITLQIANLQFQKLLGDNVCGNQMDKALSDISDTIIYLSDTVDDFQTYFRTDKEAVEVNMQELLSRAVNFCVSRVKENNIKIKIDVNEVILIKTYANEFVQVILNILNNAIDALNDYSSGSPIILIEVKLSNNLVNIKISDNAAGISSDNLIKLFEPYFSTKGKNGTGLGLYMSQMIVEKQFGGKIDVQSSNNGSIFIIRVPQSIS